MSYKKTLIVAVLACSLSSWTAAQVAVCGSCFAPTPTRIQCVSEYQFFVCDETEPRLYTCLKGFCTADDPDGNPCSERKTSSQCSTCRQCNGFTQFACTTLNTYRRCDAAGNMIGADIECSAGTYCHLLSRRFDQPCSPFSGSELLCYREASSDFCAGKLNGNYPDPEAVDCSTFIACVDEIGTKHTCIAPKVFSPLYNICVDTLVYECS